MAEIVKGTDGLVRRVKVQVGERNSKGKGCSSKISIVERPVQKLVLLLENNE